MHDGTQAFDKIFLIKLISLIHIHNSQEEYEQ
jgi:hypothetical protein